MKNFHSEVLLDEHGRRTEAATVITASRSKFEDAVEHRRFFLQLYLFNDKLSEAAAGLPERLKKKEEKEEEEEAATSAAAATHLERSHQRDSSEFT